MTDIIGFSLYHGETHIDGAPYQCSVSRKLTKCECCGAPVKLDRHLGAFTSAGDADVMVWWELTSVTHTPGHQPVRAVVQTRVGESVESYGCSSAWVLHSPKRCRAYRDSSMLRTITLEEVLEVRNGSI